MGIFRRVAVQPGHVAHQRGAGCHDQERGLRKACHRAVALDPALVIEELSIDQPADLDINLVAANAVQHRHSVTAFHADLAEGSHVKEADIVAHGKMFCLGIVEPVLALPGIPVLRCHAFGCEPVGAFPAGGRTEAGTACLQLLMNGRAAHAARRDRLQIGKVVGIQQAQGLADTFLQVEPVLLERLHAADIDLPQVERRFAVVDPLGQRHARSA